VLLEFDHSPIHFLFYGALIGLSVF
jgi:hypothetical protein